MGTRRDDLTRGHKGNRVTWHATDSRCALRAAEWQANVARIQGDEQMDRRNFFRRSVAGITGTTAIAGLSANAAQAEERTRLCEPLANEYTVLWKASDPIHEIGYCPALARLPGGRRIGCMLHAGSDSKKQREWTVKVHTSDDRGRTWTHRVDVSMIDCFPFTAGSSVYVIGDVTTSRSSARMTGVQPGRPP